MEAKQIRCVCSGFRFETFNKDHSKNRTSHDERTIVSDVIQESPEGIGLISGGAWEEGWMT